MGDGRLTSGQPLLRRHYHDNDGLPDQLEVVEAPREAWFTLDAIQSSDFWRLHIHAGTILVFGTPGLGCGRVAYEIYEWSLVDRCLSGVLLRHPPTDCEDCKGESDA